MDRITKKQLQKEFQEFVLNVSIGNMKVGMVITIILFAIFAILHQLIFPLSLHNRYFLGFGLILPFLIIPLIFLYYKPFRRHLHFLLTIVSMFSSLAVFFVGLNSRVSQPGYDYYFVWVMLVITGTYIFFRTTYRIILPTIILIFLSFVLAMVLNNTLTQAPEMFFRNVSFVLAMSTLGFFISRYEQEALWKVFIHERELSEYNAKLLQEMNERRKTEAALERSETNYRYLIDSVPDWIHVVDAHFQFILMNKALLQINKELGLETEVIGKHIREVFPFISDERLATMEGILKDGNEFIIEEKQVINNHVFYNEVRIIPIFQEDKVFRLITIIRDIARKMEIEKLKQRNIEQKEFLLREIHHRVKNNLAIVISLLDMQVRSNPNADFLKLANDIEMRIRAMALMHEHLYKSEELDRIPVANYIESLIAIVSRTYAGVDVQYKKSFESVDIRIETAMPLGLIVNEILSNSFKYAFPEKKSGEIFISLKGHDPDNNLFELVIRDNGIGLPKGFRIEEQSTLGMLIIRLLSEQIHAKLRINTDNGTEFTIIFKAIASNHKNH